MLADLRRGLVVSAVFFVLLGLAYPFAETGIGQAFFARQANGSLTAHGSLLVGQSWTGARWFHGRPEMRGWCWCRIPLRLNVSGPKSEASLRREL